MNPFQNRALSLSGPFTDIVPVTPNDATDLTDVAVALYVETGGDVSVVTVAGQSRLIAVPDFGILPIGVTRVNQTGTTATGLHALILA